MRVGFAVMDAGGLEKRDAADLVPRHPRVAVAGIVLDRVTTSDAAACIERFFSDGRLHQVVTVNLDFVAIARRRLDFRAVLNDADLAIADGMPLVWLSRLLNDPLPERVAGVELFHEICARAGRAGRSAFFLGASPTSADAAARELQRRYGLRVAGVYSPPFRPLSRAEDHHLVDMIKRAAPDLLFVAFGAPKQDLWIAEHREELGVSVAMGVGCIFDLLAGTRRRAPSWARRLGFEWAFRLVQEPARLWRRYLLDDVPVLALATMRSVRERMPRETA